MSTLTPGKQNSIDTFVGGGFDSCETTTVEVIKYLIILKIEKQNEFKMKGQKYCFKLIGSYLYLS